MSRTAYETKQAVSRKDIGYLRRTFSPAVVSAINKLAADIAEEAGVLLIEMVNVAAGRNPRCAAARRKFVAAVREQVWVYRSIKGGQETSIYELKDPETKLPSCYVPVGLPDIARIINAKTHVAVLRMLRKEEDKR